jgi:hypothetical protein
MKKIGCYIVTLYRLGILISIGFTTYKLARHWRIGCTEKAGGAIDESIDAAATTLEKAAQAYAAWAGSGQEEHLGFGLAEILADTKKTLERATELVQRALSRAK